MHLDVADFDCDPVGIDVAGLARRLGHHGAVVLGRAFVDLLERKHRAGHRSAGHAAFAASRLDRRHPPLGERLFLGELPLRLARHPWTGVVRTAFAVVGGQTAIVVGWVGHGPRIRQAARSVGGAIASFDPGRHRCASRHS